ncbi:hypothetical protein CTA2_834 [Colletotrichum tanaceti]|uniref:Uncharacterized protein n=1 Tax=Colletotrichum tanaceti TaxID=1306861 RepID=A0A4U6X604_9PEZI|nr:hypothetical protein CTA2_834 [Colletotrichum tanaceti]TKW50871.1 hypothetical protein CTA1_3685 [Colletotrichum tanaceti]
MVSLTAPRMLSVATPRSRQQVPILYIVLALCLLFMFLQIEFRTMVVVDERIADTEQQPPPPLPLVITSPSQTPTPTPSPTPRPTPKYKPQPEWTPPAIKDPFPLLSSGMPPPVPAWNKAKKPNVYHEYSLSKAPPLLIGFTRGWPMLLQTVVGYITAGWPADQIYVVENTGAHDANAMGRLSLQNPLYLNYTQLHMLGVHVTRTPVLLSFAQLQNYFTTVAREEPWSYYFWGHMDSFVLSYEDGMEGVTGAVGTPGYQTIYELAIGELNDTMRSDHRWGARFFANDRLTLVNPRAYGDVGGFDTLIPYDMSGCDMYWRLEEAGWSVKDVQAGIVQDVGSVLDDLRVLYRESEVPEDFGFTDPNPPPPPPPTKVMGESVREENKRSLPVPELDRTGAPVDSETGDSPEDAAKAVDPLDSFRVLRRIGQDMFDHKHADRDRDTWQLGQRGGDPHEPYAYDALGFQEGIDIMTEAGREIFRRKWGHRDCDLGAAGLRPSEAWKVEKDWE